MKKIKQILGKIICKMSSAKNHLKKEYYKSLLKKCGKDVYLGNDGIATYKNISIGNQVIFGPGVHIHSGNYVFN